MPKEYRLERPMDIERARRWDETKAELKALDERIDTMLRYPIFLRKKSWYRTISDMEDKREKLIGRLHFI